MTVAVAERAATRSTTGKALTADPAPAKTPTKRTPTKKAVPAGTDDQKTSARPARKTAAKPRQTGPTVVARAGSGAPKKQRQSSRAQAQLARKMSRPPRPTFGRGSTPRRLIVGEFIICAAIITLSPISNKHADQTAADWLRRSSALALLFLILGLIATGGQKSARFAAGLGAVVTVSLLIAERGVLAGVAQAIYPTGKGVGVLGSGVGNATTEGVGEAGKGVGVISSPAGSTPTGGGQYV